MEGRLVAVREVGGLDRVFRSGPDNNFGVLVEPVALAADGAHGVGEAAELGAEAADVDVDGALVGHFLGVAQGLKPFLTIYSTFMQRAYDMIIHDIALQNLNVRFAWIAGD